MLYEHQVRGEIASGELSAILEDYSTPFAGFYLYYPQRHHASPALRAFIDYLRRPTGKIKRPRRPAAATKNRPVSRSRRA
jgi:DNA-binding transcriptional LysR family regulator